MSKLDIFRKEWLEVVFADKNKKYGAYQLRKSNGSDTSKALLIGAAIFLLLFFSPKIYGLIKGSMSQEEEQLKAQEVVLAPPPPVNPETPPPPPVEPPPPKVDQVKMPPPIVKPDEQVRDEPPTVEKLKEADPGQREIKGDPTVSDNIVISTAVGNGPKEQERAVVEDTQVYDFVSIEKQPEFPGGMPKFYAYLQKTMKYPAMAQENNVQGKVFLSFVVEKDGKLTDIQVTRGLGSGCDEEAIRVLKASPRWVPGVQNGKPVRVKYNINVNFTLAN
jgi:protein TonB